jgi:2-amino-4-hydroxy-6-hydroxymethyldihydropteridine diphosphokinase
VTLAHIGLGSNLGDSRRIVADAIDALSALPHVRSLHASALYETPPWGVVDQPPFVNAVAQIETAATARALLDDMLAIERAAGRVRDGSRWGPRALDLDLLLYGGAILSEPGLDVPHPRIAQRAFVLLPLADIAPDIHVPGAGRVRDLLARVDADGCRRLA